MMNLRRLIKAREGQTVKESPIPVKEQRCEQLYTGAIPPVGLG